MKPIPKPETRNHDDTRLPAPDVVDKFRETFSIYISRMPYADRATQLKYLKDRRARLHAEKIKNAKVVTPVLQQSYDNNNNFYIKPLAPPMSLKPPPPPRTRENSIEKIFTNHEPKQPAFIFI